MQKFSNDHGLPKMVNPPAPPIKFLTDDEIKLLEEVASYFYTPEETAIVMEIPIPTFLREMQRNEGQIYTAYMRGRLQSEMDLRKSIIKLAKAGSSPAQTMAMDLLNKSKLKML